MIRRGFGRVGRPGLLGTVARTAVIAGTATAVTGGMRRRQEERAEQASEAQAYEQQQQYAAPTAPYSSGGYQPQAAGPAAPGAVTDVIAQLEKLGDLKDRGLLTDAEFASQKARLLGE
jgi:hypothetical protein